jgi:hypothetical protein
MTPGGEVGFHPQPALPCRKSQQNCLQYQEQSTHNQQGIENFPAAQRYAFSPFCLYATHLFYGIVSCDDAVKNFSLPLRVQRTP